MTCVALYVLLCVRASRAGVGPGLREGAGSAPRPLVEPKYGGGVARSLRHGGYAWPDAGAGGSEMRKNEHTQWLLEQHAWCNKRAPTRSEARLWSALSGRQLGVAFRRQVPLANRYIADFLAPTVKLVIEVDGE